MSDLLDPDDDLYLRLQTLTAEALDDMNQAIVMLQDVHSRQERIHGPTNRRTLRTALQLAENLIARKRTEEAKTLLTGSLQKVTMRTVRAPGLEERAHSLLAHAFARERNHSEATEHYRVAIRISDETWGNRSSRALWARHFLVPLLISQERLSEAEAELWHLIRARESDGKKHGTEFKLRVQLIEVLAKVKRLGEAESLTRELHSLWADKGYPGALGEAQFTLAKILRAQGRTVEALSCLESASELLVGVSFPDVRPAEITRLRDLWTHEDEGLPAD